MNVVYLNYYYDADIQSPKELLKCYWSTVEWCKAVSRAGASRISIVQRFHTNEKFEQDGVEYHFVTDEFSNKLPPFAIPHRVHKVVSDINPHVVHHNGWSYPLSALRKMLPMKTAIVWQHHGGGIPQWYSRPFYRHGFRVVDGFFFTSNELVNPWYQKGIIDYFKPIYEIIESSSTLSLRNKTECRNKLKLAGEEIFLWVGKLDENKDPLTVLEGFHQTIQYFKDPHLYLVFHEEPLLQEVKDYCSKYQLVNRVHLIGNLDRVSLESYYNASDYFVLGSHSEGSGFALLEALSCGLVPIVTDIPSFRKITSNGLVGALWDVGNSNSFAEAVLKVKKKNQSRTEILKFFNENLSFDMLGKQALESYESIHTARNSNKKKIALLVPGGVDRVDSGFTLAPVSSLISRLSENFDIHVYSLIRLIKDNRPFYCGNAKVKLLEASPHDYILKKFYILFNSMYNGIRNNNYNLLHGLWGTPTGFVAVLLGKMLHIPSVVTLMGGETANLPQINYGNMRQWLLRAITKWTIKNADHLVVLTEFQRQQLQGLQITRNGTTIIPLGVDTSFFDNSSKRNKQTPIKFVHISTLTKVKDQVSLLYAFKEISHQIESHLDIVGADYLNGELQELTEKLGLSNLVTYHGMVDHNNIYRFYREADIMLHTSLHESQSMVVAEAAASGVVVCGTRVGLISDFQPDKAIAVDVGDYKTLAQEVLKLITDQAKMDTLRSNAHQWATEHDLNWTVLQISALYEQMTSKRN